MRIADEVRRALVQRCRSRRTRKTRFVDDAPTKWMPWTVRDPSRPHTVFTEDRAWTFVADALEAGTDVDVITLKKPAGKKGYVMVLQGHGLVRIYVKLQLGSDCVIGRSFHESRSGHQD